MSTTIQVLRVLRQGVQIVNAECIVKAMPEELLPQVPTDLATIFG